MEAIDVTWNLWKQLDALDACNKPIIKDVSPISILTRSWRLYLQNIRSTYNKMQLISEYVMHE